MHGCMDACVSACVRACVRECVRACVRADEDLKCSPRFLEAIRLQHDLFHGSTPRGQLCSPSSSVPSSQLDADALPPRVTSRTSRVDWYPSPRSNDHSQDDHRRRGLPPTSPASSPRPAGFPRRLQSPRNLAAAPRHPPTSSARGFDTSNQRPSLYTS